VGDTKDKHTPANELEAASLGVCQPTEEDGKDIGKHLERLRNSIGLDSSETESTSSFLRSCRRRSPSISTLGKWAVDEVANKLLDSVVRGSLGELDGADQVGNCRHGTCDTTKSL
jgi:hypothetical protein